MGGGEKITSNHVPVFRTGKQGSSFQMISGYLPERRLLAPIILPTTANRGPELRRGLDGC